MSNNTSRKYELLIIGAGPAGVSAALYAKSRGINLALIEKKQVGGLISNVSKVSHYTALLGGETGPDFRERLEKQLDDANIEVIYEEALNLEQKDDNFLLETNKNKYSAEAVIIAAGSVPKSLNLNSNNEYISHEAFANKDNVKNKIVVVCGGSDGAAKEAIFLSNLASKVIIVQDQDKLMMIDEFRKIIDASSNIEIMTSSKVQSVEVNNKQIVKVSINNNGTIKEIEGEDIKVFAYIGQESKLNFANKLVSTEAGFIISDTCKTETAGLFVAGDCRTKKVRQIATAVADGCEAAIMASQYLIAKR